MVHAHCRLMLTTMIWWTWQRSWSLRWWLSWMEDRMWFSITQMVQIKIPSQLTLAHHGRGFLWYLDWKNLWVSNFLKISEVMKHNNSSQIWWGPLDLQNLAIRLSRSFLPHNISVLKNSKVIKHRNSCQIWLDRTGVYFCLSYKLLWVWFAHRALALFTCSGNMSFVWQRIRWSVNEKLTRTSSYWPSSWCMEQSGHSALTIGEIVHCRYIKSRVIHAEILWRVT